MKETQRCELASLEMRLGNLGCLLEAAFQCDDSRIEVLIRAPLTMQSFLWRKKPRSDTTRGARAERRAVARRVTRLASP